MGSDAIRRSVNGDWEKLTIHLSTVRIFESGFEFEIMFDYVSRAAFKYKMLSAGAEHFSGAFKQAACPIPTKILANK